MLAQRIKESIIGVAAISLFLLATCEKAETAATPMYASPAMAENTKSAQKSADESGNDAAKGEQADQANQQNGAPERKVIYNANVRVVVKQYQAAQDKFEGFIERVGGYVSNRTIEKRSGSYITVTITMRVPAAEFKNAMKFLGELGYIESESVNSDDITDQYYDLAARLDNAKKSESQLLEIMAKQTSNLTEYLAVHQELTRVRGDIESMEGRLKLWNHLVAFSTITAVLEERTNYEPPPPPTFLSRIGDGFGDSLGALVAFVKTIAVVIVMLIPWLVAMAVVIVPLVLLVRRSNKKKTERQQATK
jgi:hypothetical protein